MTQTPIYSDFTRTTWVSQHEVKPTWIIMKQEMIGWQWHQLDHMQIIRTSLQTDNHASTSSFKFFYRPDALPDTQPTESSKHWRQMDNTAAATLMSPRAASRVTDRDTDGDWVNVDESVFVERWVRRLLEIVRLEHVAAVTIAQEPALIQLHRPICSHSNRLATGRPTTITTRLPLPLNSIFQVNLDPPASLGSSSTCSRREPLGISGDGYFTGWMSLLPSSHQCRLTEWDTKH